MDNSSAENDLLCAMLAAEKERGYFHEGLLQQAWSMANGVENEAGVIYDSLRLKMLRSVSSQGYLPSSKPSLPDGVALGGPTQGATPPHSNPAEAKRSGGFRRPLTVTVILAISITALIWAVQWHRGLISPKPLVTEPAPSAAELEADRLFEEAKKAQRVPAGLVAAFPAYLIAAEAGSHAAMITVAQSFRLGVGTDYDDEKASAWEEKAFKATLAQAAKGNAESQIRVANMYRAGRGTQKDHSEAAKWEKRALESLLDLANAGDAEAQYLLAISYDIGDIVPSDKVKAVEWALKAANQSNSDAQWFLGSSYSLGEGVPKDGRQAMEWMLKSAQQGDLAAQASIGDSYAYGDLIPQDTSEAVKWYQRAADQGEHSAQCALASIYRTGKGLPKSAAKAMEWYRRAADQGDALAQCEIAEMYLTGEGVIADKETALKWYHRAAAKGSSRGQHALGRIYAADSRTAGNLVQGYKWLALAAAENDAAAKTALRQLETRMSQEEITEAQRLAADFVPWRSPEFPGRNKAPHIASQNNREGPATSTPQMADEAHGKMLKSGTGFFITADGYLMTAQHVVEGAKTIKVHTGHGTTRTAHILREDKKLDFALLKIEAKDCVPLTLAPNSAASLGLPVMTVGFPNPDLQGTEPKYTDGKISSLTGAFDDAGSMQVSVPLQPGNSGGALTDTAGQVLGMVTHRLDALKMLEATGTLSENVNYAVKSGRLREFLKGTPAEAGLLSPAPPGEANPVIPSPETIKRVSLATVLVVVGVDR